MVYFLLSKVRPTERTQPLIVNNWNNSSSTLIIILCLWQSCFSWSLLLATIIIIQFQLHQLFVSTHWNLPERKKNKQKKNKWLKNSSTSYREENIIWHSIWKPLASLPLFGRYTESNNVIISYKTLKISILHDKVQHQDIRRDVQWEPKNKKTCHQYTCLWLVCWDQFPHQSKLKGNTIYSHMSIKLFCFT